MIDAAANPFIQFISPQGAMILDGGLATTLEAYGHDLNDDLWSAKLLLEDPDAIRRVHSDFLAAGADCIATSTYQATIPGFQRLGLTELEAEELLRLSARLAVEARDEFWSDRANREGRLRPLVAASVGPYGAFLADGSEYKGRYAIDDDDLYVFHRRRWQIFAESEVDLLACETVPSREEAVVLAKLLRETPDRWAWMSFSCKDETHISDGTPLAEVAGICDREPQIAAVGINCTPPEYIPSLIADARKGTSKPIIVYPNSGELYDAVKEIWHESPSPIDLAEAAVEWVRLGAAGVGGCCRVGPSDIANMRKRLMP